VVDADDVADGVDVHLVEAAVFTHPVRQPLGAGAVGVGQVGDGELAEFGMARVAELRQALGPVPDQVAEHRRDTELVVQPQLGDAVDVAHGLGELEVRVVGQPPHEGRNDLLARQAQAARPAHGQHEGKAELGVVVGVELLDAGEFLGCAVGQAGLALLVRRLGGQRLRHHRLARQFRVGAHQPDLRGEVRFGEHPREHMLHLRQRGERALRQRTLGDPR
jgi:hypothetical protein